MPLGLEHPDDAKLSAAMQVDASATAASRDP
jgi:hypothetical protein